MASLTGGQTCHSIAAICLTGGFLNDPTSFDGMAQPHGRPDMPLIAAICLTGGILNDSTSFDCLLGHHVCVCIPHTALLMNSLVILRHTGT